MKKVIIALTLALAVIAIAHPFVGHKQDAATLTTLSDPGSGGGTTL